MSRYSTTVDNIISDYYETSASAPPQKRTPRMSDADADRLPSLTRSITQSTSGTVASSAHLVGGHNHRRSSRGKSFFSGWKWHPNGPDRKDLDREEMAQDEKVVPDVLKPPMKPWHGWRHILFCSWFNLLLVFLPAAWVVNSVMEDPQKLVFIFCTLALLPLVKLHDLATRELAMRIGGSKTGLLNASMSNTVELVVATTALRKCQLRVVQSSLIGSMLSKMLLVLGMCFFAGGLRFSEQDFDPTATGIQSSLLSISVAAVLMPAAYHFSLSGGTGSASDEQKEDILRMSHGVALVLLSIHVAYLLFQFWSHTHLFKDNSKSSQPHDLHLMRFNSRATLVNAKPVEKAKVSPTYDLSRQPSSSSLSSIPFEANRPYNTVSPYSSSDVSLPMSNSSNSNPGSSSSTLGLVYSKATPAPALGSTVKIVHDGRHGHAGPATQLPTNTGPGYYPGRNVQFDEETIVDIPLGNERNEEPKEEPVQPQPKVKVKEPKLSWPMTIALLVVVAVLVSINAEWLVESMNGLSTDTISKEWIALILLPTVSCIAECVTAINVSVKDQLTLSISVAVGSTIQTALFVIPFMIILGWIINKPLAMLFDPFESVVLYISVNVMGYVVADGKSNWLEGAILICLYIIIAVSFWFYPGSTFSSTLAVCASDPTA